MREVTNGSLLYSNAIEYIAHTMRALDHTESNLFFLKQEMTNVSIEVRFSYEVYCLLVRRRVVWYLFTTVSGKYIDSIHRVER